MAGRQRWGPFARLTGASPTWRRLANGGAPTFEVCVRGLRRKASRGGRRFNFPEAKARQTIARLEGGTAKAIGETVKFLKEQGKVETVLPDYSPYVSAKFVTE